MMKIYDALHGDASFHVIFSRNILLTGDYDRFNETDNGWHSLNVKE